MVVVGLDRAWRGSQLVRIMLALVLRVAAALAPCVAESEATVLLLADLRTQVAYEQQEVSNAAPDGDEKPQCSGSTRTATMDAIGFLAGQSDNYRAPTGYAQNVEWAATKYSYLDDDRLINVDLPAIKPAIDAEFTHTRGNRPRIAHTHHEDHDTIAHHPRRAGDQIFIHR